MPVANKLFSLVLSDDWGDEVVHSFEIFMDVFRGLEQIIMQELFLLHKDTGVFHILKWGFMMLSFAVSS
jgi:hypothetical protein